MGRRPHSFAKAADSFFFEVSGTDQTDRDPGSNIAAPLPFPAPMEEEYGAPLDISIDIRKESVPYAVASGEPYYNRVYA